MQLWAEGPIRQASPPFTRHIWVVIGRMQARRVQQRHRGCADVYSVHQQPWPQADPQALHEELVTIVVQVNGQLRDRIQLPAGAGEEQAVKAALSSENVQKHLNWGKPRTGAYVPDRLLNLVV